MRKQLMLFFLLLFVFLGFGQDINQTFENGNTAYNAGQFEKATMFYKEILESGEHSAALYFNIANCYYRLNNVAESIFFFEKAKQLNPLDEDIKINSTFAQNMAIDAVIWIYSIKEIEEGEELTYDYGYDMEHFLDHPCLCGTKNCIGYIVREDQRIKVKKLLKKRKKKPSKCK